MSADKVIVADFNGNVVENPKTYTVDWDASAAERAAGIPLWTRRFTKTLPQCSAPCLAASDTNGDITLDEVRIDEHDFKSIDKIIVVACGTASYAGQVAKYAIEHWVRIPVEIELAHEFRYRDPILTPRTPRGGHFSVRRNHGYADGPAPRARTGSKVLAICNTQVPPFRANPTPCSTHAGPEVAVASTKAFVAQITAAYPAGPVSGAGQGRDVPR